MKTIRLVWCVLLVGAVFVPWVVHGQAEFGIVKEVVNVTNGGSDACPGDVLGYTLTYSNNSANAIDALICENIPVGSDFVPGSLILPANATAVYDPSAFAPTNIKITVNSIPGTALSAGEVTGSNFAGTFNGTGVVTGPVTLGDPTNLTIPSSIIVGQWFGDGFTPGVLWPSTAGLSLNLDDVGDPQPVTIGCADTAAWVGSANAVQLDGNDQFNGTSFDAAPFPAAFDFSDWTVQLMISPDSLNTGGAGAVLWETGGTGQGAGIIQVDNLLYFSIRQSGSQWARSVVDLNTIPFTPGVDFLYVQATFNDTNPDAAQLSVHNRCGAGSTGTVANGTSNITDASGGDGIGVGGINGGLGGNGTANGQGGGPLSAVSNGFTDWAGLIASITYIEDNLAAPSSTGAATCSCFTCPYLGDGAVSLPPNSGTAMGTYSVPLTATCPAFGAWGDLVTAGSVADGTLTVEVQDGAGGVLVPAAAVPGTLSLAGVTAPSIELVYTFNDTGLNPCDTPILESWNLDYTCSVVPEEITFQVTVDPCLDPFSAQTNIKNQVSMESGGIMSFASTSTPLVPPSYTCPGAVTAPVVSDLLVDDFASGSVGTFFCRFREADIDNGWFANRGCGTPDSEWQVQGGQLVNLNPSTTGVPAEGAVAQVVSTSGQSGNLVTLSFDYSHCTANDEILVHLWGYDGTYDLDGEWIANFQAQNGGYINNDSNPNSTDGVLAYSLVDGAGGFGPTVAAVLSGSGTYSATFDVSTLGIAGIATAGDFEYIGLAFGRRNADASGDACVMIENLSLTTTDEAETPEKIITDLGCLPSDDVFAVLNLPEPEVLKGMLTFNPVDTSTLDGCRRNVSRAYEVVNACDEVVAVCTMCFTYVVDDSAPVISGAPAGRSLGCFLGDPADLVAFESFVQATAPLAADLEALTITDDCDLPTCHVAGQDERIDSGCEYILRRTFTATDVCGNQSQITVEYTVNDQQPEIIMVEPGADLGCQTEGYLVPLNTNDFVYTNELRNFQSDWECLTNVVVAQQIAVGPVEIDGTGDEWLTSTTLKPNDIDGDNIYGTFGAIHFRQTTAGALTYVSSGTQFNSAGYRLIDNLSGGADTQAGIALSQFDFRVTTAVASTDTLRIGVMHDVLSAGEWAADFGWSVQLLGVTGANAGLTATSTVLPGGNGMPDMVFFDVAGGVAAGDEFRLVGVSNGGRGQNPYISSVTLDVGGCYSATIEACPDLLAWGELNLHVPVSTNGQYDVIVLDPASGMVVGPLTNMNAIDLSAFPASSTSLDFRFCVQGGSLKKWSASFECAPPDPTTITDAYRTNGCEVTLDRTYRVESCCDNEAERTETYTYHILPDAVTVTPLAKMELGCIGSLAQIPAPDATIVMAASACEIADMEHVHDVKARFRGCTGVVDRVFRVTDLCGQCVEIVQPICFQLDTAVEILTVEAAGDLGCLPANTVIGTNLAEITFTNLPANVDYVGECLEADFAGSGMNIQTTSVPVLTGCAPMCSRDGGICLTGPGWTMRQIDFNTGYAASAANLLAFASTPAGDPRIINEATASYDTINHNLGAGTNPWPLPGGLNTFTSCSTGQFQITSAPPGGSVYTFRGRADDHSLLYINGQQLFFDTSWNTDTPATIFLQNGIHSAQFYTYEGGGGDNARLEVAATPGSYLGGATPPGGWELLRALPTCLYEKGNYTVDIVACPDLVSWGTLEFDGLTPGDSSLGYQVVDAGGNVVAGPVTNVTSLDLSAVSPALTTLTLEVTLCRDPNDCCLGPKLEGWGANFECAPEDPSPYLTISDSYVTNNCDVTMTRTYRAEDCCGEFHDRTAVFTYRATPMDGPIITGAEKIDLGCIDNKGQIPQPSTSQFTIDSGCDQAQAVFLSNGVTKVTGICNLSFTRYYAAADACSQTNIFEQQICFQLEEQPLITAVETGGDLGCQPPDFVPPTNIAAFTWSGLLDKQEACMATCAESNGLFVDIWDSNAGGLNSLDAFFMNAPPPDSTQVVPGIVTGNQSALWPNGDSNNFTLRWRGCIKVPACGTYTFCTRSDDGSFLYINGQEIVNNAGLHGQITRCGDIYLEKGCHTFESRMFEAGGGEFMQVQWESADAGIPLQDIPDSVFFTECCPDLGADWTLDELDQCEVLTISESAVTNACVVTLDRTYRLEGCCGAFDEEVVTFTYTLQPESGPSVMPLADLDLGCIDALADIPTPNAALLMASSACSVAEVKWEGDNYTECSPCAGSLDRVYRATDLCGTDVVITQVISFTLSGGDPMFTALPAAGFLGCGTPDIPLADDDLAMIVGVSSNCIPAPFCVQASRICLVQNLNDTIQIAEIIALDANGVNVAAQANGGVASGSSAAFGSIIGDVNDGNSNGAYNGGSVWHSDNFDQQGATVCIDFAAPVNLASVQIFGRTDCCGGRQNDFTFTIFDASGSPSYQERVTGLGTSPGATGTFALDNNELGEYCYGCPLVSTQLVNEVTAQVGCEVSLTRTWMIEDECGNKTFADSVYRWIDTPTNGLSITGDLVLDAGCIENFDQLPAPSTAALQIDNSCFARFEHDKDKQSVPLGAECDQRVLDRIYIAEDYCGNTATFTQQITFVLSPKPPKLLSIESNVVYGCQDDAFHPPTNIDEVVAIGWAASSVGETTDGEFNGGTLSGAITVPAGTGTCTEVCTPDGSVQLPFQSVTKTVLDSDFDTGADNGQDLDGWTDVMGTSFDAQSVFNNGGFYGGRATGGFANGNANTQDAAHNTLLMRSPTFMLDPTTQIQFQLAGGQASAALPVNASAVPVNASRGGAQGVGLRRASDGAYLLTGRRAGNGVGYQTTTWTPATLAAIVAANPGETFTLDYFDYYFGGWGFAGIDDVLITRECDVAVSPGTYETTIDACPDLQAWQCLQIEQCIPDDGAVVITVDNGGGTSITVTNAPGGVIDLSVFADTDVSLNMSVELIYNGTEPCVTPSLDRWQADFVCESDMTNGMTFAIEDTVYETNCIVSVVRDYMVMDCCGFTDRRQQTFLFGRLPELDTGPLMKLDLGCIASTNQIPPVDLTMVNASSSCAIVSIDKVSVGTPVLTADQCTWSNERVFAVETLCNVTQLMTQSVCYILNTGPPRIDSVPAYEDYACQSADPRPIASATNNVVTSDPDNNIVSLEMIDEVRVMDDCRVHVSRTWRVEDCCAAFDLRVEQYSYIGPPSALTIPMLAPLNLGCISDLGQVPPPNTALVAATNSCGDIDIAFDTETAPATVGCLTTFTRTYEVTDICGNTGSVDQEISYVLNPVVPLITALPADADLGCQVEGFVVPPPTAADTNAVTASGSVTNTRWVADLYRTNDCETAVSRVWEVIDCCGNPVRDIQEIVFNTPANTPDTSKACPADIDLGCITSVGLVPAPITTLGTATGCSPIVMHAGDGPLVVDGCETCFVRTNMVMDACGAQSECSFTICYTLNTQTPVITDPGPGGNLGCQPAGFEVALVTNVTVSDDNIESINHIGDTLTTNGCVVTVTRTWEAVDCCGGTDRADEIFTFTLQPSGLTVAALGKLDLGCISGLGQIPPASPLVIQATSSCNIASILWLGDTTNTVVDGCIETVERGYEIVDVCGNTVTARQEICYILDEARPIILSVPALTNAFCAGDPYADADPGVVDAIDPDGNLVSTTLVSEVRIAKDCMVTVTRTWRVEDCCGKFDEREQVYQYWLEPNDIAISNIADLAVGCIASVNQIPPPVPANVTVDAFAGGTGDSCPVNITWVSDTATSNSLNGCTQWLERVYRVEVTCATALTTQNISYVLDVPPVITGTETGGYLGCQEPGFLPPPNFGALQFGGSQRVENDMEAVCGEFGGSFAGTYEIQPDSSGGADWGVNADALATGVAGVWTATGSGNPTTLNPGGGPLVIALPAGSSGAASANAVCLDGVNDWFSAASFNGNGDTANLCFRLVVSPENLTQNATIWETGGTGIGAAVVQVGSMIYIAHSQGGANTIQASVDLANLSFQPGVDFVTIDACWNLTCDDVTVAVTDPAGTTEQCTAAASYNMTDISGGDATGFGRANGGIGGNRSGVLNALGVGNNAFWAGKFSSFEQFEQVGDTCEAYTGDCGVALCGDSGTYTTTISGCADLISWLSLNVDATTPGGTDIQYTISDGMGGTIGPVSASGSSIDLSSLSPAAASLSLTVTLSDNDIKDCDKPVLESWKAETLCGPQEMMMMVMDSAASNTATCEVSMQRTYLVANCCGTTAQKDLVFTWNTIGDAPTLDGLAKLDLGCISSTGQIPAPSGSQFTLTKDCDAWVNLVATSPTNQLDKCRYEFTRTYAAMDACGQSNTFEQAICYTLDLPPDIVAVEPGGYLGCQTNGFAPPMDLVPLVLDNAALCGVPPDAFTGWCADGFGGVWSTTSGNPAGASVIGGPSASPIADPDLAAFVACNQTVCFDGVDDRIAYADFASNSGGEIDADTLDSAQDGSFNICFTPVSITDPNAQLLFETGGSGDGTALFFMNGQLVLGMNRGGAQTLLTLDTTCLGLVGGETICATVTLTGANPETATLDAVTSTGVGCGTNITFVNGNSFAGTDDGGVGGVNGTAAGSSVGNVVNFEGCITGFATYDSIVDPPAPAVTFTNHPPVTNLATCTVSQDRTYRVENCCGQFHEEVVNFTWTQTPELALVLPPKLDIGCIATTNQIPPLDQSLLQASSTCAIVQIAFVRIENVVEGACTSSFDRVFAVETLCNVTQEVTQSVCYVLNSAPPLISVVPAYTDYGCQPLDPRPLDAAATNGVVAADADNNIVSTQMVMEVRLTNNCEITVSRVWRVEDCCGLWHEKVETYRYIEPPSQATVPVLADLDLGCVVSTNQVPLPNSTLIAASNSCGVLNVAFLGDTPPVTTGCVTEMERVYSLSHLCSNIVTITQNISWVLNTMEPWITAVPPGGDQGCQAANHRIAPPTAADTNAVVVMDDNPVSTTWIGDSYATNGCDVVVTRTWEVIDCCNHKAQADEIFTYIVIPEPPSNLALCPQDIDLGCIAGPGLIPGPVLTLGTATNGCQLEFTHVGDGPHVAAGCSVSFVRTNRVEDLCGQSAECSFTITYLLDTNPPVITAVPPLVDVLCADDPRPVPLTNGVTSSDDHLVVSTEMIMEVRLTNDCDVTVTRTWRVEDCCGNFDLKDEVYRFMVQPDDPTIGLLADVDMGCITSTNQIPQPNFSTLLIQSACNIDSVAHVSDMPMASDRGACYDAIARIYQVTDACAATASVTQKFHYILDVQPPRITSVPPYIIADCSGDPRPVPLTNQVVAVDPENHITNVYLVSETRTTNACLVSVDRLWRVEDCCGRFDLAHEVYDYTEDPQGLSVGALADIDLGCIFATNQIPAVNLGAVQVSSPCAATEVEFVGETVFNSPCSNRIDRTFRAVDLCDNAQLLTQSVFYVINNPALIITAAEPGEDFGCQDAGFTVPVPTAASTNAVQHNGGDQVTDILWVGDFYVTNDCSVVVRRVWQIIDCCQNAATREVFFSFVTQAATGPDFSCPADMDLGCINNLNQLPLPEPGLINVSSACDAAAAFVSDSGALRVDDCTWRVVRTYSATDNCGQTGTCTQNFTFTLDSAPPRIVALPPYEYLGCQVDDPYPIPRTNLVMGIDDSSVTNAVLVQEIRTMNDCQITVRRIWRIEDCCGNFDESESVYQYIEQPAGPVLAALPPLDIGCIASLNQVPQPNITGLGITAGCAISNAAFVSDSAVAGTSGCTNALDRIYQVTDLCGQMATVTQRIVYVLDTGTPRIVSVPPFQDYLCVDVDPRPVPLTNQIVATDADNQIISTEMVDEVRLTNDCDVTVTRVWRAEDCCGKFDLANETYRYTLRPSALTAMPLADLDLGCLQSTNQLPSPASILVMATSSCSIAGIKWLGDTIINPDPCASEVERTYEVTDRCGATLTITQTINYQLSTEPPRIQSVSNFVDYACDGDLRSLGDSLAGLVAIDVDGGLLTTQLVMQTFTTNDCVVDVTRMWRVEDCCGRFDLKEETYRYSTPPTNSVCVPLGQMNLAGLPVSSHSAPNPALPDTAAFDGSSGTRWESVPTFGAHWIYVDLLQTHYLEEVCIDWHRFNSGDYGIYLWDGTGAPPNPNTSLSAWTLAASVNGHSVIPFGTPTAGVIDDCFDFTTGGYTSTPGIPGGTAIVQAAQPGVIGRYLMVYSFNPADSAGISIWDISAKGGLFLENPVYPRSSKEELGCIASTNLLTTINPPVVNSPCPVDVTFQSSTPPVQVAPCLSVQTNFWLVETTCLTFIHTQEVCFTLDTAPPMITAVEPFADYGCAGDVRTLADSMAGIVTADADGNNSVLSTQLVSQVYLTNNACRVTVSRTWRVTDCCSNTHEAVETYAYDLPPATFLANTPPDLDLGCIPNVAQVPPPDLTLGNVSASCPVNVTLVQTQALSTPAAAPCELGYERVYQATTTCATLQYTQRVTYVLDAGPPVITAAAPFADFGCAGDIRSVADSMAGLVVTDPDGAATVITTMLMNEVRLTNDCQVTVSRTWMVDCCSNTAQKVETYQFTETPQSFQVSAFPDLDLGCIQSQSQIPPVDTTLGNITSSCPITVSFVGSTMLADPDVCTQALERVYQVVTVCDNALVTQRVSWTIDTAPPRITAVLPVTDYGCAGDQRSVAMSMAGITSTDADGDATVISTQLVMEVRSTNDCTITVSRMWRVEDCCGNFDLKEESYQFANNALLPVPGYIERWDASEDANGCVTLTDPLASERGTAWSEVQLDLSLPFTLNYSVLAGQNDGGADGLAFLLHNDPAGLNAVGGSGGNLGASGISPAVGVTVDTWPASIDETYFFLNGNLAPVNGIVPSNGGNIEDGLYHPVTLTWDPATFTYQIFIDGQLRHTLVQDLVNTVFGGDPVVYFGWTAGTGGSVNEQGFCQLPSAFQAVSAEAVELPRIDLGCIPGIGAIPQPDLGQFAGDCLADVRVKSTSITSAVDTCTRTFTRESDLHLPARTAGDDHRHRTRRQPRLPAGRNDLPDQLGGVRAHELPARRRLHHRSRIGCRSLGRIDQQPRFVLRRTRRARPGQHDLLRHHAEPAKRRPSRHPSRRRQLRHPLDRIHQHHHVRHLHLRTAFGRWLDPVHRRPASREPRRHPRHARRAGHRRHVPVQRMPRHRTAILRVRRRRVHRGHLVRTRHRPAADPGQCPVAGLLPRHELQRTRAARLRLPRHHRRLHHQQQPLRSRSRTDLHLAELLPRQGGRSGRIQLQAGAGSCCQRPATAEPGLHRQHQPDPRGRPLDLQRQLHLRADHT